MKFIKYLLYAETRWLYREWGVWLLEKSWIVEEKQESEQSVQKWSCQRIHKALPFLFSWLPSSSSSTLHEILMCPQVLTSSLEYLESHAIQKMVKLLLWSHVSLMIWPVRKDKDGHVPPSQDSISKTNNVKHSQLALVFYSCHHNSGPAIKLHPRCYKSRLFFK